jgi:hypothetical protein
MQKNLYSCSAIRELAAKLGQTPEDLSRLSGVSLACCRVVLRSRSTSTVAELVLQKLTAVLDKALSQEGPPCTRIS